MTVFIELTPCKLLTIVSFVSFSLTLLSFSCPSPIPFWRKSAYPIWVSALFIINISVCALAECIKISKRPTPSVRRRRPFSPSCRLVAKTANLLSISVCVCVVLCGVVCVRAIFGGHSIFGDTHAHRTEHTATDQAHTHTYRTVSSDSRAIVNTLEASLARPQQLSNQFSVYALAPSIVRASSHTTDTRITPFPPPPFLV